MSNFHPRDVVGRGSETQDQVGEYLNDLISVLMVSGWHWSMVVHGGAFCLA